MNILLWIIFGGLAGWLASVLTGSDASIGVFGNIVIGIVGAFIGGWIADTVNFKAGAPGADRPTNFWGFFWAVMGAVVLIFLINLIA